MSSPSLVSTVSFLLVVFLVASAPVVATVWSGRRLGEAREVTRRKLTIVIAVEVVFLAVTFAIARAGLLSRFDTLPPPLMRLLGPTMIAVVVLAFGRAGGRLARTLPLAALVGFHGFRVLVELVLFSLHRDGVVPPQMTFAGLNYDVVTGLTALPVAFLYARGTVGRGAVLAWNVMGTGLLFTIITIAMLSVPGPLRVFMNEPANRIVATAPFIWLPEVLVAAALFGHLVIFRSLAAAPRSLSMRAESAPQA